MSLDFTLMKIDTELTKLTAQVEKREQISGQEFAESVLEIARSLRNGLADVIREFERLGLDNSLGRSGF